MGVLDPPGVSRALFDSTTTTLSQQIAAMLIRPWVAGTAYPIAGTEVSNAGTIWQAPIGGVPARGAFTPGDWVEVGGVLTGSFVPLGSASSANTQPNEFWVSKGSKASDSNSGDKDSPFSTIQHAVTTAEALSGAYVIYVGFGNWTITSVDGSGNALTQGQAGSCIKGINSVLSQITLNFSTQIAWGIKQTGAAAWLQGIGISVEDVAPYWITGVSGASSMSAESCTFDDVQVVYESGCTVAAPPSLTSTGPAAAFALGPDHPGFGTMDIADVLFSRCLALNNSGSGISAAAYLAGNGTSGNVLANTWRDCIAGTSTGPLAPSFAYGIYLGGADCAWFGGGFSNISTADIKITHNGNGPTYFEGIRGENGNQALNVGYIGGFFGAHLFECYFAGYTPTGAGIPAGAIIQYDAAGPLKLTGGYYSTVAHNTILAMAVSGSPGSVIPLDAWGVTTDNPSFWPPSVPANYSRNIYGAHHLAGGVVIPTSGFQALSDGSSTGLMTEIVDFPANPGGSSSTTGVMAGLAEEFTPVKTGKMLITITGMGGNGTPGTATFRVTGVIGTGTPPANGVAEPGSGIEGFGDGTKTFQSDYVGNGAQFVLVGNFSPALAPGTTYWADIVFETSNAAQPATLTNISVNIRELL
jgi:hypothetical protein